MNFYNPNQRPNDPPPEPPQLLGRNSSIYFDQVHSDGQEVRKTFNIKITGVLAETRAGADYSIYMRMDEVNGWNEWARGTRINRNKEGYGMLIVKAENPDVVTDIADQITAMGFMANTPQAVLEGINSFFTVLQVVFGGVGAIALLVAAIGIANTMTMSILERTREIGLMKAVGATNRDVMSVFLGEAAGIGFIGGLGGVLIGWGMSAVLNLVGLSYFAGQVSQNGGLPPTMITSTPLWLPIFGLFFAATGGFDLGVIPRVAGCHHGAGDRTKIRIMKFHPPNKAFSQAYRKFLFRPMGRLVLILTTIGRKTGRKHSIGLQYELIDGIYYVGAADGIRADWYRNILKNPNVEIQAGAQIIPAVAEAITDPDKITRYLEYRLKKHPLMIRLILRLGWHQGEGLTGLRWQLMLQRSHWSCSRLTAAR